MAYARRLTKADLLNSGITEITVDGKVFKGDKQVNTFINKQGYIVINICDFDENGERKRRYLWRQPKGCIKPIYTYIYIDRTVGLHRAMWAWFHGEVPEGWVIDHKSNKHTDISDYTLDNLQLLTPRENVNKDRKNVSTRMLKCQLKKPLEFYETKLVKYEALYEQAKLEHNAELAHKYRANIANTRARIRYYNANIEKFCEQSSKDLQN